MSTNEVKTTRFGVYWVIRNYLKINVNLLRKHAFRDVYRGIEFISLVRIKSVKSLRILVRIGVKVPLAQINSFMKVSVASEQWNFNGRIWLLHFRLRHSSVQADGRIFFGSTQAISLSMQNEIKMQNQTSVRLAARTTVKLHRETGSVG